MRSVCLFRDAIKEMVEFEKVFMSVTEYDSTYSEPGI